jgi:hypothetical protein
MISAATAERTLARTLPPWWLLLITGIGWTLVGLIVLRFDYTSVSAISILFAGHRLWTARGGRVQAPANASPWVGGLLGVASGFTSQIAHAGQPPFQMYVLPKKLPPASLVGTTAIYFATINWLKVPAYAALGQFTPQNLSTVAVLLPVAILSTLAGVWLVRRIQPDRFYTLIYGLMIPVGAYLIWKAFAG